MTEPPHELPEDLASDLIGDLIPFGQTIGKRLVRPVVAEWKRNRSVALRAAETASQMTREQLADWVANDPAAIPLYMKVLWAAGMNGHDPTLRAMGTVLGHAAKASEAGRDEEMDDAELALRAMSDLVPKHFKILGVLSEGQAAKAEDDTANLGNFMPEHVAEVAGMRLETVNQCLLNLAAAGLATTSSVYGGIAYPITSLGRAVIAAAREIS